MTVCPSCDELRQGVVPLNAELERDYGTTVSVRIEAAGIAARKGDVVDERRANERLVALPSSP